MTAREPWQLTATEALQRLRANSLTVTDYAKSLLSRIDQRDSHVRAWVYLDRDLILANAARLDSLPVSARGPLHGLPVGIKDVMLTSDMPTQHNNRTFESSTPSTIDASIVRILRCSGALIFGKTATTEWAAVTVAGVHQNHTVNSCVPDGGATRTPGGSSSGSAAAVADGHVPLALGTQTAGSTVRPASYCGIWGWKPTWGAVSREGSDVYSWSNDTMGFFAKDAEVFETLRGVLRMEDVDGVQRQKGGLKGLRVGFCRTAVWEGKASEALQKAWERAKEILGKEGVAVQELDLPEDFGRITKWHGQILAGEGRASFLSQYLLDRDNLEQSIVSQVENKAGVSRRDLLEAYDGCARLRPVWDEMARGYDVVITPSVPDVAPKGIAVTGDPAFNLMWTILHVPSVNMPGFAGEDDMPLGFTAVGARFTDEHVLKVAREIGAVFERDGGWTRR